MIKEMVEKWTGKKYIGAQLKKNKIIIKSPKEYQYFPETFKVMEHIDQEEERLSKEMTFTEELELYKSSLKDAKNPKEYEEIEEKIKHLERMIRTKQNKISVTIPEDKVNVIIKNYEVEKDNAKNTHDQLVSERIEVSNQIEKLKKKEKELKKQGIILKRMMEQAEVLSYMIKKEGNTIVMAHNNEEEIKVQTFYKMMLHTAGWYIDKNKKQKIKEEVK